MKTGLNYVQTAQRWDEVEQACAELGLPTARPAREDVQMLLHRAANPGPNAVLTHMDLNPTNVLITGTGARLVDFEGCWIGHLGIDACFLHYPFPPHSTPWSVLPQAVVELADAAYQTALADGGAHQILAGYQNILADGAALVLIARLSRLPLIARLDQSPHDSWRRRGQIVQQIQTCTQLVQRAGRLHALADWLSDSASAMTNRWPDATNPPTPLFPAFAT